MNAQPRSVRLRLKVLKALHVRVRLEREVLRAIHHLADKHSACTYTCHDDEIA